MAFFLEYPFLTALGLNSSFHLLFEKDKLARDKFDACILNEVGFLEQ